MWCAFSAYIVYRISPYKVKPFFKNPAFYFPRFISHRYSQKGIGFFSRTTGEAGLQGPPEHAGLLNESESAINRAQHTLLFRVAHRKFSTKAEKKDILADVLFSLRQLGSSLPPVGAMPQASCTASAGSDWMAVAMI